MKICLFIKENNEQCKAHAMNDSDFCFTHNPEAKEAKKLAVIKGGKSPKRNYAPLMPVEIKDNKSVVNLLATTIGEVRQGTVDLRVANCIGYLAGHLIKALEVASLEDRLSQIEELLLNKNRG